MANTEKRKSGKNNIRFILVNSIIFLCIASALVYILVSYLHIGDDNYTNDAQIEAYVNPVNTRVSAYIKEIRFQELKKVKKGDTLVILDDRELQTQLGQAEAAYSNALASKQVTFSTINTVSNNLKVIDANVTGAKARYWNAEENYKRYASLLKDEAVTQQQYDQMKTEKDAQQASYESLVSQRESANFSIAEANSKIALNDAEIKRTESALAMARLNLSYTVITAPYDGVMGRRTINTGQLLQAGQQIGSIVTNDRKWVVANFREKQMSRVRVGTKMAVKVDALKGKLFEAEVTAISEATGAKFSAVPVDNSTGNFVKVQQRIPVRIEFTSANSSEDLALLRAGMNVEVKLK
ncbi:membrane fusion protein, multidrug efflux system [bacterium A37T11]|nr:membrane fusion protein, multidrug efflux system [bacterium A37T11]